MFDDDVSVFCSHPNKEVAEAAIGEAMTNVAEWSRHRKLTLNASKREVAFFISSLKKARWQPSLQLDGTPLNTTSLPKFLIVTTNRALSFGPHVVSKAHWPTKAIRNVHLNPPSPSQVTGYLDGSARAGIRDSGAGVIVTCGDTADPIVLHWSHLRGTAFTSSFAEEAAAIELALEWATANHPEHSPTICTDSESLLKAIERRSPVTIT